MNSRTSTIDVSAVDSQHISCRLQLPTAYLMYLKDPCIAGVGKDAPYKIAGVPHFIEALIHDSEGRSS